MMAEECFIPYFPSIPPAALVGEKNRTLPFPLDAPRAAFYYFARNGIWHGIDALGLTADDEVLMPSYNNGMEIASFVYRKIPLVYYRVDRQMRIDLDDLVRRITPKTKVIYVIYYLGFPHPIREIRKICDERGIYLFEDCALSFMSEADGRPQGSWGDLSIFCLGKFLPVPNGGMLVLNNPKLALPGPSVSPNRYSVASQTFSKILDHYETHGRGAARFLRRSVNASARSVIRLMGLTRTDSGVMEFLPDKVDWGMSPLCSRIISRLDYDEFRRKRRENYLYLQERTQDIPGAEQLFPGLPEGVYPLFFPMLVSDNQVISRRLKERRVMAGGFWNWNPPAFPVEQFPDIAWLRKHVLELQIHQDLDRKHLDYTVEQLKLVL